MDKSKAAQALQAAFEADPCAMHSLMVNRVPCNMALADDPFVVVDKSPVLETECFQVGALGLINAVLVANGLPLIAAEFSDPDEYGRRKVTGFCDYLNTAS